MKIKIVDHFLNGIIGLLVLTFETGHFLSPPKHIVIIDSIFDLLFLIIEGSDNKHMHLSLIFTPLILILGSVTFLVIHFFFIIKVLVH